MREFDGKTAVVTGAASGIGRGLAGRFARAGMQVVLADIEEEPLKRAVRELEQDGHRTLGVVTDTMRRESVEALVERAIEEFGKVGESSQQRSRTSSSSRSWRTTSTSFRILRGTMWCAAVSSRCLLGWRL